MIVKSENIEFGYELVSVIPYAYYLHSKGLLTGTESGNDTEPLYYFSPNHKINPKKRDFNNFKKVECPNIKIHKPKLDKTQFLIPPYKQVYLKNNPFNFDKELVIICNRHNTEWNVKPINYFDLKTLERMFDLLQDRYQIIYINVEGRPELYDNAPPRPFGDFELLKKYPKVLNIHDLVDSSFNLTQLQLFAKCSKFITMNGGHALLAAYFGGENIIMSKHGHPQAQELKPEVNSFYRWYHEFSGQWAIHVPDENKLIDKIKMLWVNKLPTANILIRTAARPNAFARCMDMVSKQTYKNIKVIVSVESQSNDYTIPYPVYPVHVVRDERIEAIIGNHAYGRPFPANVYFNEMYKLVQSGLVIYHDDDNMFTRPDAVEIIMKEYMKGKELLFWKVENKMAVYPDDDHWNKAPANGFIDGNGFAFDAKLMKYAEWEPYKRGDFRVTDRLYKKTDKVGWIELPLVRTMHGHGNGWRKDIKIHESKITTMEKLIEVRIVRNILKGRKTGHVIGQVKNLPESVAKALIMHGIASLNTPVEVKKEKEPEVLKSVKKPLKAKK